MQSFAGTESSCQRPPLEAECRLLPLCLWRPPCNIDVEVENNPPEVVMPKPIVDFPVFDADNHMYETMDAFTKFLPTGYEGLVK